MRKKLRNYDELVSTHKWMCVVPKRCEVRYDVSNYTGLASIETMALVLEYRRDRKYEIFFIKDF